MASRVLLTGCLILALLAGVLLSGCEGEVAEERITVTFNLVNQTTDRTHLYMDWETASNANGVEPAQSRTVQRTFTIPADEGVTTVAAYAYRNGLTLGTLPIQLSQANDGGTVSLYWNGTSWSQFAS